MQQPSTILPSKSFYDLIAPDYNEHLAGSQNDQVRKYVERIFTSTVLGGTVLDFGGGTGLDLPWLGKHYRYVYFLEPSNEMRAIARQEILKSGITNIHFAEQNLDFHCWSPDNLPVKEKVAGTMANFAVLNCIENIATLFRSISLISNPGSHFLCTVLDVRWHKILKHHPVKVFVRSLTKKTPEFYNNYKGFGHTTYLHSISSLKELSKEFFFWDRYIPLKESPFALLVLRRR